MADNNVINLLINVIKRGGDEVKDLANDMGDFEKSIDRVQKRQQELNKTTKESTKAMSDNEREAAALNRALTQQDQKTSKLNQSLGDLNRARRSGLATQEDLHKAEQRHLNLQNDAIRTDRERMDNVHKLNAAVRDLDHTHEQFNRTNQRGNAITREGLRGWNILRQEVNDNNTSMARLERRLARLGRAIMGLAVAGVLIFMQSLNSAIVGLAGQAIALAGSLTYAAGALGGIFVAAIGQAIPVVGLLVMVMQRLHIVMQAVTQANLVQKQSGRNATQDAQQQADATDQLVSAQENLLDAQRNLTEARRDARRELEDLILAEKRSQLTSRDAASSLSDALQSGDIGAVQQAQLDLQEARLGASRSREDLSIARAGGPGSPQDRVLDATRQLAAAQRGLAAAHRSVAENANDASAAESNLAFFESQLTPAERKLEQAIIKLQQDAKKLFAPITDTIIGSFTFAIGRLRHLILDPSILSGFKKLADSVSELIKHITVTLTNNKAMAFWNLMLREARRNLGPIEEILNNVFAIFRHIAEAAAPVLHKFLKLIADETGRWAKGTRDVSGLTEFFFTGLKHLRAWWRLIKAIVGLWGELMGLSGSSALETLQSLTDTINGAKDSLESDKKGGKSFFEESAEAVSYLGDVLVALGEGMVEAFDPSAVKALRDLLVNAIIPGLVLGIKLTGEFAKILDWVLDNIPFADKIVQWGVAFTIFGGTLGLLKGLLGGILGPLGSVIDATGQWFGLWENSDKPLTKFIKGARAAFSKIGQWASAGTEAASNFISNFGARIRSSRAGQAVSRAFRRVYTRVALWAELGIVAAGNFLDAFMGFMRTKVTPRIKRLGRFWGVLIAAGIVAGIILAITDEKFRNQVANAFGDLVAIFADLWEAALNVVVDKINDVIRAFNKVSPLADVDELGQFDWKQKERDKVAAGEGSKFSDKAIGLDTPERISPKRRQEMIEQSNIDRLAGLASGETPNVSAKARKDAMKDLKELNKQGKLNADQQAQLAQATKKANKEQQDYHKQVDDGIKKNKDYRNAVKAINDALGDQEGGAKKAKRGVDILNQSLSGASGSSRDLGKTIADVTNKILKQFGVKPLNFGIDRGGGGGDPNRGTPAGGHRQTGGLIGSPYERGPDDRLIAVAGGEAVLTGHHQRAANIAFGAANAMGILPYSSLNDMFNKDQRMHMTSGFARGGMVDPGWDPGSEVINRRIAAIVGQWARRYGADITAGYDPGGGHVSPGHNISGTATDVVPAGGWGGRNTAIFERGLGTLVQAGFEVGYSGQAGTQVWADHGRGDHAHIEWVGNGTAANAMNRLAAMGLRGAGLGPAKVGEITISGPASAVKTMLQGQSDKMRDAANEYLKKKIGFASGAGMEGSEALGALSAYNRSYPANSQKTLAPNVVAALAEHAGLPGITFQQIARGESAFRPGAVSPDGGYGMWQMTPRVQGESTLLKWGRIAGLSGAGPKVIAKMRGPHRSYFNPWLNAQMAKYLYDSGGIGNWFGTSFLTDTNAHFHGKGFDQGGIVPGPLGMPTMVQAHAGETILPTHKGFQSGGIVNPDQILDEALKLIRKAPSQLKKIRPNQFAKLLNALNEITREEGAIDDIAAAIEQLATIFATKLTRMALKFRHGIVAQVLTNVQMAELQLNHLVAMYDDLNDEFIAIGKTIRAIGKRIKKTKDKAKKQKLRVVLDGLRLRQQEVEDALAQQLQDILDAQEEAWQAVLDTFDQRIGDLDIMMQILQLQGELSGAPDVAAEVANLEQRGGILQEERAAIQAQLAQAISVGDVGRATSLNTALLENQLAILQNTQALNELNGTMGEAQSFNSSAWTLFRQAVLNGMGGLLPQYQAAIPSLQTGGRVTSGGLVNLHAGEVIHDANAGPVEQHYHFTEPMEVADPTVIGAKIAWEWKKNKV